ncbi:hypothetical protein [Halomarina ordinaria]|uniref:Uncharacterized protein n=1 Tax=Halomarina ordinaria TaxID=3033939 RepID=A0ABD5U8M1_9EURY|nr:hypothetical protein [Halomarina sp. PSRA2]
MVYRAILPDGDIECSEYDRGDKGVDLYGEGGTFVAFVPYANLIAILDEEHVPTDERSIM